jgi:hypothetical protein
MNDDQLTRLLRQVDEPASPDPAFADRLFGQLTGTAAHRRGVPPGLMLVAALTLVAALAMGFAVAAGLVRLPWLSLEVVPAPSGQPSGQPIESPAATPSQTPEQSASPSPSGAAIAIDGLAKSTVDALTVRADPTTSAHALGSIDTGQMGFAVAGPVSADGYDWYQLSGVGLPANAGCEPPVRTTPFSCPTWLGWVAAGRPGGEAWLAPATVPCPTSPMNLEALVSAPLTPLERLACYRSTRLTFRAWWPEIPGNGGLGGTCGDTVHPTNPVWLVCGAIMNYGLVISPGAGFDGPGLRLSIDPASGVTMPPRGQWVEVVAHLDDPAARDCVPLGAGDQDPVSTVLSCRGELVADSVTPVAGPY